MASKKSERYERWAGEKGTQGAEVMKSRAPTLQTPQ
jgi:hypothetical protein